jgi:hypothetical protein
MPVARRATVIRRILLLGSCLVGCSGADARAIDLVSNPDGGGGKDGGDVVVQNGGTVSFDVAKAYLTRGQWCGSPPPFTPADVFQLVLVGPGPDPSPRIQISVHATAPVGAPQSLTPQPWKPGKAPKPGENDINQETAILDDARRNNVLAFSLARGTAIDRPDPNPYDQATLTVLAIPKKEGDTLQVRVQLHFPAATLDQTFVSPPLAEAVTPCGGNR